MTHAPKPDFDFAIGVACFEAYVDRTGESEVPADHVEPITPDVLRKAADILEREPEAVTLD